MVLLASDGPTHQGCGGGGRPAKHGCDCHLQREREGGLGFRVLGLCVYGKWELYIDGVQGLGLGSGVVSF